MEEDESVEVELPEEIARPFDFIVRRMAKVKTADDRANRDMRHGAVGRARPAELRVVRGRLFKHAIN